MDFKDYFPIDMLLNPPVYFMGTISLYSEEVQACGLKTLKSSSKTTPDSSLYQTFIKDNYMKKFDDFFRGQKLSPTAQRTFFNQEYMNPSFVYSNCDIDNKELGCRNLRFGPHAIIAVLLHHFYPSEEATELQQEVNKLLSSEATYDEIAKHIKTKLIQRKKEMEDVIDRGRTSPYFSSVKKTIANTGDFVFDISTMLEARHTDLQVMLTLLNKLKHIFHTPLNMNEFKENVDYAKFCLLIAARIIKSAGLKPEDYIFISLYLKAIKEYRQSNPGYTCSVKLGEETSQEYSVEDLEKEFAEHKIASPEIISFLENLDRAEELFKRNGQDIKMYPLSTPEGVNKYKQILQREEQMKTLARAWNVFPRGHKTPMDESLKKLETTSSNTPKSEKIRRKLEAYQYLEASDYLFKIEGINEFEGYIGYVYSSGKIVFEKFYDNFKTKTVAVDCATYTIKNFKKLVEISMLSKPQIIEGLKQGELSGDVARIYHDLNLARWRTKIDQSIVGSDYTEEIINFITELIEKGKLEKKRQTK